MVNYTVKESDWKLFRKLVPSWQENYMNELNKKYIEILNKKDVNPSDIFWELEKTINKDKKHPGVIVQIRRSMMEENIFIMVRDGVITLADLSGFSSELQERINFLLEIYNRN